MNKLKPFLLVMIIGFLLNSCSNEPDYDGMAKELCECMKPLAEMQKKVEALAAAGKIDEINAMLSEVEQLSNNGDACVEELEAKFGVVLGEGEKKADAAFKKACPEIAGMIDDE